MKQTNCSYESAVVVAAHSNSWDDALFDHVTSCAHCGELIEVMEWTRSLTTDAEWPPLSDPGLLWIKSEYLRAEAAQRCRMRRLLMLQSGCAILFVVSAVLLAPSWHTFQTIPSLMLTLTSQIGKAEESALNLFSPSMVSVSVAVLVAAVTFIIRPLFSEN